MRGFKDDTWNRMPSCKLLDFQAAAGRFWQKMPLRLVARRRQICEGTGEHMNSDLEAFSAGSWGFLTDTSPLYLCHLRFSH